MLKQSIIVAAHPDDEVLWFSSILEKVSAVVVCFISNEAYPKWAAGRRQSLMEYPIKNTSCLQLDEAGVLNGGNWQDPVETEYGLKIVHDSIPHQRIEKYKNNYHELKQRLEKRLDGYQNVFAHNPWGEYGHEEHVQVHRVIKCLQSKMGFNFWYPTYVAPKSFKLMSSYRERTCFESVVFETNRVLAREVKEIYKKNKCWTWHDDWDWFKEEVFIKEVSESQMKKRCSPFPINFIKVGSSPSSDSMITRSMKKVAREISHKFGLSVTRRRVNKYEQVVSLRPNDVPRGTVLLSWLITPFLLKPGQPMPDSHTQYWDCHQIAQTFLDMGYAVDVIDSHNQTFHPTKPYALFIGHRINFDRLAGLLNGDCIKIAYLDTAHWVFNNHATYQRKLELQQRKGVTIKESHRLVELNLAIEHSDYAVTYGNQFALGTYRYANKPLFRVPISTCALFPWPEHKDHNTCRANFLWFGSHGFVHKGLDLVLEAFAGLPECQLYVCGPLEKEKDFVKVFYQELYQTPNIHAVGWVDVNGPEFVEVANRCVGFVFPSCSESGGGSVIAGMHAGLIPLVTYESSVDVDDFGVVFKDHRIETIKDTVRQVTHLSAERLYQMARKAWECARATYTREQFAKEFRKVVSDIIKKPKVEQCSSGI